MEIKDVSLIKIKDIINFSSSFFLPTCSDGIFDALKFCQKFEDKKNLKLFCSKINNKTIGYISVILHKETNLLDIGPMFILKEFSGKGYGKKQVEFVINWAKENNFKGIETRTWGKNYGSRKIFESLNFKMTKEIKNDRINNDSSMFYKINFKKTND